MLRLLSGKKRLLAAALLTTVVIILGQSRNNSNRHWSIRAQTNSTDWVQLQRDPQRTGYSPSTVKTSSNYSVKWRWHPADRWTPISEMAQPVVAGDRVYISDFSGIVYSLSATTGTEQWKYTINENIYGGLALIDGKVIAGTQEGSIYALSQANGSLLWKLSTKGGVVTSPLISDNSIIVTNKAGEIVKISTNGSMLWKTTLPAPIMMSPAANTNGTVFVGAENLKAYALDSLSGSILWEKQLIGDSFRFTWPVVAQNQGIVFFRSEPKLGFHTMLNNPSQTLENGRCINFNFGECHPNNTNTNCSTLTCGGFTTTQATAAQYLAEQEQIRVYLQNRPNEQTFFALDMETGNTRYIPPILYTGGGGGWPTPPVINTSQNIAYVIYRSYYSMFDSSTTVRPYVDIAKMDIATGTITPFPCKGIGNDSCKLAWEDFHLVGDEETHLSATANAILVGSWMSLGGISLSDGSSFFSVQAGNTARTPTLIDSNWAGGTYAGGYSNPIPAVSGNRIFYRTGLLGMIE